MPEHECYICRRTKEQIAEELGYQGQFLRYRVHTHRIALCGICHRVMMALGRRGAEAYFHNELDDVELVGVE